MKNITIGKLITVVYATIFISNITIFYFSKQDPNLNPYTTEGSWPIFTGISILITISIFVYAFLQYVVKNWDREI